jgi:dolichol-phosphate mannosyltransferase
MRVSFVIPTLNEHGNITRLIERINKIIKKINLDYEIIVIDDNSTDGTIEAVKNLQKIQENLNLFVREKQQGIGSAHIEGYNQAQGDLIISMDADLSHPPEKIPEFIAKIKSGFDMVMSSRYILGGATDKNLKFYLVSKIGGYYLSLKKCIFN